MKLPRGFKAESERISNVIRGELGLKISDTFDVYELANHLGIPIVTLDDLANYGATSKAISHLKKQGREDFSAVAVFRGTHCIIVINPTHAPSRLTNTIAHELSHLILGHEPRRALGTGGCREWDEQAEAEANWLAGALLIPRDAALLIAGSRENIRLAAKRYGVSLALLNWRLNHTGARKQVERARTFGKNKSW